MSDRIVLVAHDSNWAYQFEIEADLIKRALPGVLRNIEHIGSTSIAAVIVAKPIIDMLLIVDDLAELDAQSPQLEQLGYEAKGESGIPGRRYFRKDSSDGVRTHHLHAFATGSPHIARHLDFRDYLRSAPLVAAEYARLKERLATRFTDDRIGYTDGKTAFITQIESDAAKWRKE